ncbi:MAG: hypothetical protein ACOYNI_01540 [Acidimicrobiia bacterium]
MPTRGDRPKGYIPHFLQGPPRRLGEARVPDPRAAERRQDDIGLALHALATEYRNQPSPAATAFVERIVAEDPNSVPPGVMRRLESAAQAVIGGWRVLSFGVEPRITDQTVAWFAWIITPQAPPFGWLSYWTIAWAAHQQFVDTDWVIPFPLSEPDLLHDQFLLRRDKVLGSDQFEFRRAVTGA